MVDRHDIWDIEQITGTDRSVPPFYTPHLPTSNKQTIQRYEK